MLLGVPGWPHWAEAEARARSLSLSLARSLVAVGATQQSGTAEALRQNGKLCLAVGLKYGMLNEAVVDEWDAKRRSG